MNASGLPAGVWGGSALAGLIFWLQSPRWPYLLLSAVTGGLPLLTKAPAGFLPIWFGLVWPAGIWRLAQLIMRKSPSPGPSPLRGRGETGSLLPLSRARERGLSLLVLAVQVGLLVRVWPYPIA